MITDTGRETWDKIEAFQTQIIGELYGLDITSEAADTAADKGRYLAEVVLGREELVSLDYEMLQLAAKRQRVARKVGKSKRELGMQPEAPDVRDAKLSNAKQWGQELGMTGDLAVRMEELLINDSEAEQRAAAAEAADAGILSVAAAQAQLNGYIR